MDTVHNGLLLYDALKASYLPTSQAGDYLKNKNYLMDNQLSNIETKVFYNPDSKHLVLTNRGSQHLLNDWLDTNIKLMQGKLNESERYYRSKDVLEKARQKYNTNATIVGDSLGGSLSHAIASNKDKIYSFNKGGSGIVMKNRTHEKAYRQNGDVISMFGKHNKNSINLGKHITNPLKAHSIEHLKNKKIYI